MTAMRDGGTVLRPFEPEDAGAVVEMLDDYAVSKWLARVPCPFGLEDLRLFEPGGGSRWPELAAICEGGTLVGAISMRPEHLGYWLGAGHWGRGTGTRAARLGVGALFAGGAEGVLSAAFEGNVASRRILEGLGFAEAGRSLAPCLARGEDVPNVDYRLDRAAWDARREGAR